jgi:hypothetical protein
VGNERACPLCGEPVTLGGHRIVEDGAILAVVADPPGTFYPHLRDRHPAEYAEAAAHRERLNRALGARMGASPRKVDGTLLLPGQLVTDIAEPPAARPLPAWEAVSPTVHRHGVAGPAWWEHSHLGGGEPHAHDPETGFQVPVGGGLWPHEEEAGG